MRICLISHLTDRPDEGVRGVAAHLARSLRARHEVSCLAVNHPATWRSIRRFRPDVIHFVLSPTVTGLLVAWTFSLAYRQAHTVLSAPHPGAEVFGCWPALFKPDLVLAQALESERKFGACGYRAAFLPNGVDTGRFIPVSAEDKRRLREKYGIADQFVVLHVGSPKWARNVQMLGQLQRPGRQVLIVGRPSDPSDNETVAALQEAGCLVWCDYFEDIQEIYALSDCYVFPVSDPRACIETPLSVLEALACNLPVVSTPFGALSRVVPAGEGMVYAQTPEAFEEAIAAFEAQRIHPDTRRLVLPLSWANLVRQLEDTYEHLC